MFSRSSSQRVCWVIAKSKPWNNKIETFPYVSLHSSEMFHDINIDHPAIHPSKYAKYPDSSHGMLTPETILNFQKTSWIHHFLRDRPVAKWVAHVCHSPLSTQRWKTKPEQARKGDGCLMGKWFSLKSSFLKEKNQQVKALFPDS